MATLATLAAVTILIGVCIGAYLKPSFAIRREDRSRTLRCDAPSYSAQTARTLVGFTSSRWD